MPMLTTSYPVLVIIGLNVQTLVIALLLQAQDITNVQIFDEHDDASQEAANDDTIVELDESASALLSGLDIAVSRSLGQHQQGHQDTQYGSIERGKLRKLLYAAMLDRFGADIVQWKHSLETLKPARDGETITASFKDDGGSAASDTVKVVADAVILAQTSHKVMSSVSAGQELEGVLILGDQASSSMNLSRAIADAQRLLDAILANISNADSYQRRYNFQAAFAAYKKQ